jgi:uroporphyrinogen decarboxylase
LHAYQALLEFLGLQDRPLLIEPVGLTARPCEALLRRLGIDTRYLYPVLKEVEEMSPLTYTDRWGVKRKFTGQYYDALPDGHPLAAIKEHGQLDEYPWPNPRELGGVYHSTGEGRADLVEQAERLAAGEYAVIFPYVIAGSFAFSMLLRGYERFLIDLGTNPRLADRIMARVTDIMVELVKILVEPVGRYLDAIFIGDDLGAQNTPIIPPELYRRYVKPKHRRLVEAIKAATKAPIILHTDGAIEPFLEDLIDVGFSGINPVQVSARGMETRRLKERYGDRLVFWGGVDTQRVLSFGSEGEVRSEVRRRIDDLAPGGGYILTSVHNIQPHTPPTNVVAMFDEAHRYGQLVYQG